MAPTLVNGVQQAPIEGVSMVYAFDDAAAPSKRTTQYFEMFANRAIYDDGWVATTTPTTPPWVSVADSYLHTMVSVDAGTMTRLTQEQAFRFARGEEVTTTHGLLAKLSRP